MSGRLGILAASIMAAISAIHVYWAAGGTVGSAAAVPEMNGNPALNPGPLATIVVALAMVAAAVTVAVAAVQANSDNRSKRPRQAAALIALIFAIRAAGDFRTVGFSKRIHGTRFATMDSRVYSPLCAFLSVCCAGVAK